MNRDKTYIVSVGYNHLVVDDPQLAVAILSAKMVEREYLPEGGQIYTPSDKEITVATVSADSIRPMTTTERENKELASAKQSERWASDRNKELTKQVEELKCQLKVALTKPEEV